MQTLAVQQALIAKGFVSQLGPSGADGVWGRCTIAAVSAFQHAGGLKVTGVLDPQTMTALFGDRGTPQEITPSWYTEATRLKGLREIAGDASNPTILGWAAKLGGWVAQAYRTDATPWCGLFVAHCVSATLPSETLPSNPLSALAWAKFGRPTGPALGAILAFSRKGGGHVGFYAGEDGEAYSVLGGNQSDAVTITRVAKSRLVAMRWPSTVPLGGGRITVSAIGELSNNEA